MSTTTISSILDCIHIMNETEDIKLFKMCETYLTHNYNLIHQSHPEISREQFDNTIFSLYEEKFTPKYSYDFDDSDYGDVNKEIAEKDKQSRVNKEEREKAYERYAKKTRITQAPKRLGNKIYDTVGSNIKSGKKRIKNIKPSNLSDLKYFL